MGAARLVNLVGQLRFRRGELLFGVCQLLGESLALGCGIDSADHENGRRLRHQTGCQSRRLVIRFDGQTLGREDLCEKRNLRRNEICMTTRFDDECDFLAGSIP